MEIGGVNYLIPTDAKLAADRDAESRAVALEQVIAAVSGARKLKLVMLDACRDNPFEKTMQHSIALKLVTRETMEGRIDRSAGPSATPAERSESSSTVVRSVNGRPLASERSAPSRASTARKIETDYRGSSAAS
jgi:hypothetical protein